MPALDSYCHGLMFSVQLLPENILIGSLYAKPQQQLP